MNLYEYFIKSSDSEISHHWHTFWWQVSLEAWESNYHKHILIIIIIFIFMRNSKEIASIESPWVVPVLRVQSALCPFQRLNFHVYVKEKMCLPLDFFSDGLVLFQEARTHIYIYTHTHTHTHIFFHSLRSVVYMLYMCVCVSWVSFDGGLRVHYKRKKKILSSHLTAFLSLVRRTKWTLTGQGTLGRV